MDLASLFAARRGIEATIVLTPANAALIRPTLQRSTTSGHPVELLLYPFPSKAAGLPSGIQNLAAVSSEDSSKFTKAIDSSRDAHDRLLREHHPDAVVADVHFWWITGITADIGIPSVCFHVIGSFANVIMNQLWETRVHENVPSDSHPFIVPGLPEPKIQIVRWELPIFLRVRNHFTDNWDVYRRAQGESFGMVVNTFYELEREYCELFRGVDCKKAWFIGPLDLFSKGGDHDHVHKGKAERGGGESAAVVENRERCMGWLERKKVGSVIFVCFGSWCCFEDEQLREMALGLEASGMEFLWVVRGDHGEHLKTQWMPEGWEERVQGKGLVVRGWAPQAAILAHEAVGVFMTHCGWNSLLEGLGSGKPMLTWPLVFEQFINERLVVEVLKVGVRVWDGFRSTFEKEKVVVPAEAIERAVRKFMEGSGTEGEEMRKRATKWADIAGAAVTEGGSSHKDLNSLIDELFVAREKTKDESQ
ncbi:hypothetical protein J5N97_003056 [Dioscorea zingiberensis]|uniref:Glycosyltransferase n=1 Tax=Dioscorea zingiberensis TaxID=325984 RepID=A0A9D5D603_9LILI|nr:hypothetical protein J5N97_003056 [Dioscorea zingiberensis]